MTRDAFHIPILVDQVMSLLLKNPAGTYVDGTLGGGGHSQEIMKRLADQGRLVGIDDDERAIESASKRLEQYRHRILMVQGNFANMKTILASRHIEAVDGILLDLGISSYQIDNAERGFSYMHDGPLDMRMNRDANKTAEQVVNSDSEEALARIFREYGEERHARLIARKLVQERFRTKISSTHQLAEIVRAKVPAQHHIKSLARIFQALRIEVNNELDNLTSFLKDVLEIMKPGARLVIISYHSLEDRLVKEFFHQQTHPCQCPPQLPVCICHKKATMRLVTRGIVRPSPEEIKSNPRSRSAKLRAAERI